MVISQNFHKVFTRRKNILLAAAIQFRLSFGPFGARVDPNI